MNKIIVTAAFFLTTLIACDEQVSSAAASTLVTIDAEASTSYTVNVDLSKRWWTGEVVIRKKNPNYVRNSKRPESRSGREGIALGSKDNPQMLDLETAPLRDGKFTLTGKINEPTYVYIWVDNGVDKDGNPWANVKGWGFILEPGNLEVKVNQHGRYLEVEGGRYNDIVYSYRSTPEFKAALAKQQEQFAVLRQDELSDEDYNAAKEVQSETSKAMVAAQIDHRKMIATTHPDLMARMLSLKTNRYSGIWLEEAYSAILDMDPDNSWARQKLDAWLEYVEKNNKANKLTHAIDFEANDLADVSIELADVQTNSKYILLEFWASWCGPCRAEVPHMKKAYAQYNDKGFEIFAFTIDDDKEDWAEASEDEEFPWIDTGFGSESEPTDIYSVTGVPVNYLIDSSTGEIIGKHIRGRHLEQKLAELLN